MNEEEGDKNNTSKTRRKRACLRWVLLENLLGKARWANQILGIL
jgi:hypothetical protein